MDEIAHAMKFRFAKKTDLISCKGVPLHFIRVMRGFHRGYATISLYLKLPSPQHIQTARYKNATRAVARVAGICFISQLQR